LNLVKGGEEDEGQGPCLSLSDVRKEKKKRDSKKKGEEKKRKPNETQKMRVKYPGRGSGAKTREKGKGEIFSNRQFAKAGQGSPGSPKKKRGRKRGGKKDAWEPVQVFVHDTKCPPHA